MIVPMDSLDKLSIEINLLQEIYEEVSRNILEQRNRTLISNPTYVIQPEKVIDSKFIFNKGILEGMIVTKDILSKIIFDKNQELIKNKYI